MKLSDQLSQNPYCPPGRKVESASENRKLIIRTRQRQRDRALLLCVAAFGLLWLSSYLGFDFFDTQRLDPDTTFNILGYSFVATIVTILVLSRDKNVSRARTSTDDKDLSLTANPIDGPRDATKRKLWQTNFILFLVCATSFGTCSWFLFQPDPKDDQAALYLAWFTVSTLIGFASFMALQGRFGQRTKKILALANAGIAAVVFVRVVIDSVAHPTSHNLWPFEVIIACIVVSFGAIPGLAAGAISFALLNERV